MNLKVIKYFILSRFTKVFLIGTFIFLFLVVVFYLLSFMFIPFYRAINGIRINFTEFVTFFVIFSGISSTVQKADYDFLLPSPLKKSEIAILYIIASMILGGSFFISLGIIFFLLYPPLVAIISLISFALFGIAISSISLLDKKIHVIIFTAIWVWFPYFNIPFSPTELLFQRPLLGVISSLVYSIPIIYEVLRNPQIGLPSYGSSKTKEKIKYGREHFLIKYLFLTYEFAWGYGSSFSSRRLFYYVLYFPEVLLFTFLIGFTYFLIFRLFFHPSFYNVMAPSVVILAFFMSMGLYSISQERPWINFILLDKGDYLSKRILVKSFQNALLSLPFSIADSLLGETQLGISLFFGVFLGYAFTSYLSSKLNPIQFRGEVYNYRAGGGMIIVIFTEYLILGITVISGLSMISSLIFSVTSLVVTLLITRKSVWERISYEIIEKGFI